jgi:glycosyltransferase involved in cell wall biosynthesis
VSALTVLVAARDEEARIARTVEALRAAFPGAEVVVADDGSRDGTAAAAEAAGARVVCLPRRGKGQALTLAERTCGEGALLLCDADVEGDLGPLVESGADLAVARFARRVGGGLGLAKGVARRPVSSPSRSRASARSPCVRARPSSRSRRASASRRA